MGFPPAPPSFGHPEPETQAQVTVPGGFRAPTPTPAPGPPAAPWWDAATPEAKPRVAAESLPGVLVAGPGVPVVDTRRAVPREPLVRRDTPPGPPPNETVVDLVREPEHTLVDAVLPQLETAATVASPLPPPAEPEPEVDQLHIGSTPVRQQPQETWHPLAAPVDLHDPEPVLFQPVPATVVDTIPPNEGAEGEPAEVGTPVEREVQVGRETWRPGGGAASQPLVAAATPVMRQAVPASHAPVLVPAAILPPQTLAVVEPTPAETIAAKTVLAILTPVPLHEQQEIESTPVKAAPAKAIKPPQPGTKPRSRQPLWLAVFVLVSAMVAGFVGFLVFAGSDDPAEKPKAAAPSQPAPAASVTPTAPAPSTPPPVAGSLPGGPAIDDYRTDPKPLTIREIFPVKRVQLSNSLFLQDYKSLNKRCDYAASGAMAAALVRAKCQGVVRGTFVTRNKKVGVTAGVVAMPTKAAAIRTSKAGDPANLAWFKGMPGKRTQALVDGGGHAGSTTYGRYIIYAYVQYLDGTEAKPDDPALIQVAKDFIGYLNGPLKAR
ncbi:MAG: hypothetical protein ABIS86_12730 [Streptosporangiaceae bacterium]